MAEDEPEVELEPGDFLYQSDQELFLVVTGETENGYRFAVHGWREINDHRLAEYLDGEHGKLHYEEDIEQVIEEEGDEETKQNFARLRDLFHSYDMGEEAQDVAENFALEDT